jgi:hypothetical protein
VEYESLSDCIRPTFLFFVKKLDVNVSSAQLRLFENGVLRIMGLFGPKVEEVTAGWRKVHNEELRCSLYKISQ